MSRLQKCAVILLVFVHASASYAGGSGTGTITGWIPSTGGGSFPELIVVSTSSISGTLACNTTNRFALSSTDPKYKTTVASIIAAYSNGTPVHIVGAETCNVWGNAEDISYVCFGNIPC